MSEKNQGKNLTRRSFLKGASASFAATLMPTTALVLAPTPAKAQYVAAAALVLQGLKMGLDYMKSGANSSAIQIDASYGLLSGIHKRLDGIEKGIHDILTNVKELDGKVEVIPEKIAINQMLGAMEDQEVNGDCSYYIGVMDNTDSLSVLSRQFREETEENHQSYSSALHNLNQFSSYNALLLAAVAFQNMRMQLIMGKGLNVIKASYESARGGLLKCDKGIDDLIALIEEERQKVETNLVREYVGPGAMEARGEVVPPLEDVLSDGPDNEDVFRCYKELRFQTVGPDGERQYISEKDYADGKYPDAYITGTMATYARGIYNVEIPQFVDFDNGNEDSEIGINYQELKFTPLNDLSQLHKHSLAEMFPDEVTSIPLANGREIVDAIAPTPEDYRAKLTSQLCSKTHLFRGVADLDGCLPSPNSTDYGMSSLYYRLSNERDKDGHHWDIQTKRLTPMIAKYNQLTEALGIIKALEYTAEKAREELDRKFAQVEAYYDNNRDWDAFAAPIVTEEDYAACLSPRRGVG